jgi:diguanylate cyclase (GGDEF)-like protein
LEVRLRAGARILTLERSLWQGQQEIQAINAQLQQNVERQSLINQLLRSLASSLDFTAGLRGAVIPLQSLFQASRAVVRLVERETETLAVVAEHCALDIAPLGTLSFPLAALPTADTPEQQSVQAITDLTVAAAWPDSLRRLSEEFAVCSLLSEPLFMQGLWFGDISLHQCDAVRQWRAEEQQLLKTVAQQISVVAVNSELHRKVQEQSVRDALTGLFNRRYFDESLSLEFERASRYNQPLTLVMVDLDYLKQINDEQGHLAGDAAIRQIGAILSQKSRKVDIATRFAGDEFAVLLPQTPLVGGQTASEHWRHAIHQCRVGAHRLSASIGVATYPLHADSPEALLQAADQALYRAKREGRNRVCEARANETAKSHSDRR